MPTLAYYLRACHPLGALMPTLPHACLPSSCQAYQARRYITFSYLDQARHNTLLTSMPGIGIPPT
uniref:Uncharacterized protein n=1 Tax=Picea glauca TaxID=3330 RepID=A0A101LZ21_PICGL|nr:hypothetical protein ABT39_MTgene4827 [Picea glauca]QHR88762.1 hypothetical protein Q903MT_gene2776 [Picea sitchensis]